jgi:excisionase family DNA binding protein
VKELADYLRVHVTTIYRLLASKQLPGFRIGSEWRFNRSQIDDWRLRGTDLDTHYLRNQTEETGS